MKQVADTFLNTLRGKALAAQTLAHGPHGAVMGQSKCAHMHHMQLQMRVGATQYERTVTLNC